MSVNLTKPDVGSTNWGGAVNDNFQILMDLFNTSVDFTGTVKIGGVKISAQAPSGPTADDLWYETDTNILWFWNGTYWLSCELFVMNFNVNATANIDFFFVAKAFSNDGSNYWTWQRNTRDSTTAATTFGTALSTSANSTNMVTQTQAQNVRLTDLGNTQRTICISSGTVGRPGADFRLSRHDV